MTRRKERSVFRIILAAYLLAIAYLCFASSSGLPSIKEWHFFIPADKVVHFTMFLPFPILGYFSFRGEGKALQWKLLLCAFAAGCVIACATELIQSAIPYRDGDIKDFLADLLGLLTGSALQALFCFFSARRSRTRSARN